MPRPHTKQPPKPRRPARSPAYEALADLCHRDARLTLSAADCEALEPLAAEWLDRDPSEGRFRRALGAGLPPEVHSVRGLLQRRLRDKMPPERSAAPPTHPEATPLRMVECTLCGTPARPHHLPGGLCADCRRADHAPTSPTDAPVHVDVDACIADMRRAVHDSALSVRRRHARRRSGAG